MKGSTIYKINEPNVSSEEIDGEVIIVNLLNGNYYSTVKLGVYIWGGIAAGLSIEFMVEELTTRFSSKREDIEKAVPEFVSELRDAELITEHNDKSDHHDGENGHGGRIIMPAGYETPTLSCYTDMKDLLLLDPIHDVADVGWPTAEAQASTE